MLGATERNLRDAKPEERGPLIVRAALNGNDRACLATLKMISTMFGSYVGARAAAVPADGGVYLAGGLIDDTRLTEFMLNKTEFIGAFEYQGMRSAAVGSMQISLVRNTNLAILGGTQFLRQRAIALETQRPSETSSSTGFCREHVLGLLQTADRDAANQP